MKSMYQRRIRDPSALYFAIKLPPSIAVEYLDRHVISASSSMSSPPKNIVARNLGRWRRSYPMVRRGHDLVFVTIGRHTLCICFTCAGCTRRKRPQGRSITGLVRFSLARYRGAASWSTQELRHESPTSRHNEAVEIGSGREWGVFVEVRPDPCRVEDAAEPYVELSTEEMADRTRQRLTSAKAAGNN